ncbi:MAG: energy-coupling factor transporter ATPase [Clostridia bacterium]|nr:energy-coupling factor transporter ATPase [Clostridia bacterium]
MSIKLENINCTYMPKTPFEKAALYDINIEIEKGEFVGIIGHTGSGKSTLLQHFNGLIMPDKKSTGKVYIDGELLTKKNVRDLRKKVGYVFQYPEYQLFEETVYKDIAFGLKKLKLSEQEEYEAIHNAAEIVGISDDLLERSVYDLSGGQKRRVAIAGVIVMNPDYLILDEPAAGLDPAGKDEILTFAKRLRDERGTAVVLVSHSMEDIAQISDRVIVMNEGRIVMDGKPSYVFAQKKELNDIGLSVPEITSLFCRLNEQYPWISKEVYTVQDAVNVMKKLLSGGAVK